MLRHERTVRLPVAAPHVAEFQKCLRPHQNELSEQKEVDKVRGAWMLACFLASPPLHPQPPLLQMFSLSFCQPSWLTLWLIPQGVVVKQVWQMLHKSRRKMAFSWLSNFSFRLFLNDLFSPLLNMKVFRLIARRKLEKEDEQQSKWQR